MSAANDLRKMSRQELQDELIGLRREQLELRIQRSSEQVANTAKFRQLKRSVARVKTVLNENKDA